MPLSCGWMIRPTVRLTAIRTVHDRVAEKSDSPSLLAVERDHAVFVDGGLTFKGDMQDGQLCFPISRSGCAIRW